MTHYICVDRDRIRSNMQYACDDPVFIVYSARTAHAVKLATKVTFTGPSVAVFDREHPLPNGATAWIETESDVALD